MFVKHAVDSAFSEETSVMSLHVELRNIIFDDSPLPVIQYLEGRGLLASETCFLAIWVNSCGESGQETTSSRLCWKKLLGNMRSNMMADKPQNRLLLEPTKTSKVNNKPNCSNKLCFPLILILIIFYIFEGGGLIFES